MEHETSRSDKGRHDLDPDRPAFSLERGCFPAAMSAISGMITAMMHEDRLVGSDSRRCEHRVRWNAFVSHREAEARRLSLVGAEVYAPISDHLFKLAGFEIALFSHAKRAPLIYIALDFLVTLRLEKGTPTTRLWRRSKDAFDSVIRIQFTHSEIVAYLACTVGRPAWTGSIFNSRGIWVKIIF